MPAYKLTKKVKQKIVDALWAGHTLTQIANDLGITRQAIWAARKKDKKFDEAVKEALESVVEIVEDTLYAKALSGDTTAMIFFLKNRRPDKWNDRVTHLLETAKEQQFVITFVSKKSGELDDRGEDS